MCWPGLPSIPHPAVTTRRSWYNGRTSFTGLAASLERIIRRRGCRPRPVRRARRREAAGADLPAVAVAVAGVGGGKK